mgnify:CR=1 FL=1
MAGIYALDALDYADKLNLLDIVFYRISERGTLETRLWVVVVGFLIMWFIVGEVLNHYFQEENRDDEFLLNGTTVSPRSIVEVVITWFIFSYSIGFIKPNVQDVANKLSHSTHHEKIYRRD